MRDAKIFINTVNDCSEIVAFQSNGEARKDGLNNNYY